MSKTIKKFFVCPLCARDWKGEPPKSLLARVGRFLIEVTYGPGKGNIHSHIFHAHDMVEGGTWLVEVRGAVLALARLLGFELSRETTARVVRDYTVQQGRRRIREVEQRARTWARTHTAEARSAARPRRGRGGTVAPLVAETWDTRDTVGEGGTVAEVVQEEW